MEHCPVDGGLSPWGPWSSCSLSCGGVGVTTRSRACTQPSPTHGGSDCQGPLQETTYCQAPDCPGRVLLHLCVAEETCVMQVRVMHVCVFLFQFIQQKSRLFQVSVPFLLLSFDCYTVLICVIQSCLFLLFPLKEDSGFSPWSTWSPCTKTCTDVESPAVKSRHRSCVRPPCSGSSHQDKPCNLPQCPGMTITCSHLSLVSVIVQIHYSKQISIKEENDTKLP